MVEVERVRGRKGVQVRREADYRPPIRMRKVGRAQKLLQQPPLRRAVSTQAALFVNNVTLFVELAHHRMQKTLRLKIGPQFQAVLREGVEISGFVPVGKCVQAHASLALNNL